MKIRGTDASPSVQHDSFGKMVKRFTPLYKLKAAISRGKKMKNKANFNLGKIGVSYCITSIYEELREFLRFFAVKNKANLGQTKDTRLKTKDWESEARNPLDVMK